MWRVFWSVTVLGQGWLLWEILVKVYCQNKNSGIDLCEQLCSIHLKQIWLLQLPLKADARALAEEDADVGWQGPFTGSHRLAGGGGRA